MALLQDHPRWKFLVTADGVTASSRLDKLLLMNSVTFKEDLPYMAYYYRCELHKLQWLHCGSNTAPQCCCLPRVPLHALLHPPCTACLHAGMPQLLMMMLVGTACIYVVPVASHLQLLLACLAAHAQVSTAMHSCTCLFRSLKPWVHYVPYKPGSEAVPSLLAALEQLQANDTLAQQISLAGQTFASK